MIYDTKSALFASFLSRSMTNYINSSNKQAGKPNNPNPSDTKKVYGGSA